MGQVLNVRFWHKADLPGRRLLGPLISEKQTLARRMSYKIEEQLEGETNFKNRAIFECSPEIRHASIGPRPLIRSTLHGIHVHYCRCRTVPHEGHTCHRHLFIRPWASRSFPFYEALPDKLDRQSGRGTL
jgi:hypothetical protein